MWKPRAPGFSAVSAVFLVCIQIQGNKKLKKWLIFKFQIRVILSVDLSSINSVTDIKWRLWPKHFIPIYYLTLLFIHLFLLNPYFWNKCLTHRQRKLFSFYEQKNTVKLVYKDRPRDQQNAVLIHMWSLYAGSTAWKVYNRGPVNL